MKSYIGIIIVVSILITVGLSGCEELEKLNKPNYINVTIFCSASVTVIDETTGQRITPIGVIAVNIEIIKSGGERETGKMLTPETGGHTGELSATFKLYKEQPIVCIANIDLASVEAFSEYTFDGKKLTLPWNHFYPAYDYGDSATEHVLLEIVGMKLK